MSVRWTCWTHWLHLKEIESTKVLNVSDSLSSSSSHWISHFYFDILLSIYFLSYIPKWGGFRTTSWNKLINWLPTNSLTNCLNCLSGFSPQKTSCLYYLLTRRIIGVTRLVYLYISYYLYHIGLVYRAGEVFTDWCHW